MIVIVGSPVVGIVSSGGTANEHRIRYEFLKLGSGFKNFYQIRT